MRQLPSRRRSRCRRAPAHARVAATPSFHLPTLALPCDCALRVPRTSSLAQSRLERRYKSCPPCLLGLSTTVCSAVLPVAQGTRQSSHGSGRPPLHAGTAAAASSSSSCITCSARAPAQQKGQKGASDHWGVHGCDMTAAGPRRSSRGTAVAAGRRQGDQRERTERRLAALVPREAKGRRLARVAARTARCRNDKVCSSNCLARRKNRKNGEVNGRRTTCASPLA